MTDEYGQFYLEGSQSRIIESIRLQKKRPNARIIFSGGVIILVKMLLTQYQSNFMRNLHLI